MGKMTGRVEKPSTSKARDAAKKQGDRYTMSANVKAAKGASGYAFGGKVMSKEMLRSMDPGSAVRERGMSSESKPSESAARRREMLRSKDPGSAVRKGESGYAWGGMVGNAMNRVSRAGGMASRFLQRTGLGNKLAAFRQKTAPAPAPAPAPAAPAPAPAPASVQSAVPASRPGYGYGGKVMADKKAEKSWVKSVQKKAGYNYGGMAKGKKGC